MGSCMLLYWWLGIQLAYNVRLTKVKCTISVEMNLRCKDFLPYASYLEHKNETKHISYMSSLAA